MSAIPEGRDAHPATAVAYAVAVTALGAMPIWAVSAFAPALQADLGFDDFQLGMTLAFFFTVSAVTGLPVGRLVQHWGWRAGISFSCAVAGVSLTLVAVIAHNWMLLLLALALGGISNNSSQPSGNLGIAMNVPDRRQGISFGLKQAALPITTFLTGLLVPIFDHGREWRWAFLTLALVSFVVAVMVIAKTAVRGARAMRARPKGEQRVRRARTAKVKAPKSLLLLATGAGFGTAATISLGGFVVVYAVSQGHNPSLAAGLLSLGSLAGITSRILSGLIADKRGKRHLVGVIWMQVIGSIGFLVLAIFGSSPVGLIAGTIMAFGFGWSWNGLFHLSVVKYSPIPAALATSVVQTAMSIGAAVGPTLFGFASTVAYQASWYLGSGMLLIAAVFIFFARRELGRAAAAKRQ